MKNANCQFCLKDFIVTVGSYGKFCSLSCGAKNSAKIRNQKRLDDYLLNPTACLQCHTHLSYQKKSNRFCDNSCAAIFNNKKMGKSKSLKTHYVKCKNCDSKKELSIYAKNYLCDSCYYLKNVKRKSRKISIRINHSKKLLNKCLFCKKSVRNFYCNNNCAANYRRKLKIDNWKNGNIIGKAHIKHFILNKQDYKCAICKIKEYNNLPIVLELEHIDGNSDNNIEENLCCLCPNCHSQTPTYKGKNKGNGRHKRRQRYSEGKSY